MSNENKTQLQTNNTALASLTDRVLAAKDTAAALPDAGGGGAVETCTVHLDGYAEIPYGFTVYENGTISAKTGIIEETNWGLGESTIENVVCGSLIYIGNSGAYLEEGTATILYKDADLEVAMLKAPSVAGEYCKIGIS